MPLTWANFGGGHTEMKYRKIPGGLVQMQGLIRNGTVGGGTPMFYLDAGFRPAYQHLRIVNASGATGRIEIYQDGRVSALAGSVSYFAVVTSFHLD